mgnify:CR=1 FL=1
MNSKKYCFSINSYQQCLEILNIYKNSKIIPIFYFKYNLINKFSVNWLLELICMLENQFGCKKFKTYVEVKKNYGLFINLVEEKIDYLEVKSKDEMLTNLKSIAKVNKVLINPNFSILDLTKSQNIKMQIRNLK